MCMQRSTDQNEPYILLVKASIHAIGHCKCEFMNVIELKDAFHTLMLSDSYRNIVG